jgi:hypothetical protein
VTAWAVVVVVGPSSPPPGLHLLFPSELDATRTAPPVPPPPPFSPPPRHPPPGPGSLPHPQPGVAGRLRGTPVGRGEQSTLTPG